LSSTSEGVASNTAQGIVTKKKTVSNFFEAELLDDCLAVNRRRKYSIVYGEERFSN